ncbi:MAG: hypothetical protein ABH840_01740 [Nanoarchaeota archaeon]
MDIAGNLLARMRKYSRFKSENSRSELADLLGDLVQKGYLSSSKKGNYSVESRMSPDFVVNPTYSGIVWYFTRERDCLKYSHGFKVVNVVRHGEMEFPELISPREWREFELKLKSESPEIRKVILEKLAGMGILTTCKKGAFEVGRSSPYSVNRSFVRVTGFRAKEGKKITRYYFTRRDFAQSFADSVQLDASKNEEVSVLEAK